MKLDRLIQTIEALLFVSGEPMKVSKLATLIGVDKKVIQEGLEELQSKYEGHGIRLFIENDAAQIGTVPEVAKIVEKLAKEDLEGDLTRAATETLAIVAYRGPITRADIDVVRGVNSTFILRTLMMRGLVERVPNPNDSRSYLYRLTLDFVRKLDVSKASELPDYDTLSSHESVEKLIQAERAAAKEQAKAGEDKKIEEGKKK